MLWNTTLNDLAVAPGAPTLTALPEDG